MSKDRRIERTPIRRALAGRQRGGLTIFTGIFVLVLMTLMLLYASRVGIFEQRISSNEARQKLAFHAAETALDQAQEYILANAPRIFSAKAQAIQYSATGFRAGWFANDGTTPGWAACTAAMIAMDNHPCGGDFPATTGSFFYDDPTTASGTDSLPINAGLLPANTAARLSAVLCMVDGANPGGNCLGAPADEEEAKASVAIVTMLGYGFSDCSNTADLTTCTGEARVAKPLSNFKALSGAPGVPLTTKSTFPPTGTAEIVGNPNGGGLGVPLTTWINDNPACAPSANILDSGSWQTCEYEEWYVGDDIPDDVACDATGNCQCGPGGNDPDYFLSWKKSSDTFINIDIVVDDGFPCDLFEYYFDVPRTQYQVIKAAATVLSDCSSLGPYSTGLYWISGPLCRINSNTQIGSAENPVILVSAATLTEMRGGAEIFGTLYVFDGEDINAEVRSNGNNTVYGAVIVDANIGQFQGTFQIVYNDAVLANAKGLNGIGAVSGGWRDFGLPAWQ